MYVDREWGKVRIYLQKQCGRCWHKLTFTRMYKSLSHNITPQWYMRSNDLVTSCFKWSSLNHHWPHMTLDVYSYFLWVSKIQISPLLKPSKAQISECVVTCEMHGILLTTMKHMSLRLIQEDWTAASALTNDEQTSVKITSQKIHSKQTPHDKSRDILSYAPEDGYWDFMWICLSMEHISFKIIVSAS